MAVHLSRYLKTVIHNIIFYKRKGKAGIKRKATRKSRFAIAHKTK